jgi:uncharacterized protein
MTLTKMHIDIGTTIDLQDLIKSRMLIQANSGGGKSAIARVIMEKALGIIPFIVLDIEGEYYTLKELNGDIIVIGGQHADVPISIALASKLPRFILENGLSVAVDVSDLEMHERIKFAKIFLESLMQLPQQLWVPYLIFLEECHKLAGEQDKYESGPAVKDLMSRGRKRGYCGIPITQRISKLHKDVAAECNNKFIGRTYLDIDMDRSAKELGFSKTSDRLKLRDLKPGCFYAFGTSITPHEVHEVQIKKPVTSMPQAGNTAPAKVKVATSKVLQLLTKLNEDILKKDEKKVPVDKISVQDRGAEQAEAKIAQLSRMLQEKDIELAKWKSEAAKFKSLHNTASLVIDNIVDISGKGQAKLIEEFRKDTFPVPGLQKSVSEPVKPVPNTVKSVQKIAKPVTENGKLGKCAMAILQFVYSVPEKAFSKAQVGVATGYAPGSGGFNNALSELTSAGLITRDNGKIMVNQVSDVYHHVGHLPTQEYSAYTFVSKLGKCEREIYEVLLAHPNEEFSKDILAAKTPSQYAPNSGGFNNSLSHLSTLELIERNNGRIKLNPELKFLL